MSDSTRLAFNGAEGAAPVGRKGRGGWLLPLTGRRKAHRDQTAPADEKRRRRSFRFKVTAEGFMLLVISLLVGFAAWHSGANLLYLLFSILVAIFLLHGFLLSWNLSGLQVTEQVPEMAVAGNLFDVSVKLVNTKRFMPSFSISVLHGSGNRARDILGGVHCVYLPAGAVREEFYSAVLPRRGLHRVCSTIVSTRYPFGFEERAQVYAGTKEILALPPTYPVVASTLLSPLGFGDQESQVRGSGTDLYGLREYVQGEPARHVHWRTSARAQKLMIAEYTREERRRVLLVLDNATSADASAELTAAFENAVTLTASLARHLVESGFEVGLITQDIDIPPGQGGSHLTAIQRHLAHIQPKVAGPLRRVQQSIKIIFSDTNDDPAEPDVVLLDSRDWKPPVSARVAGEKNA